MVGNAFLHQIGATPLAKSDIQTPFLPPHFTKQVATFLCKIFIISF